MCAEFAINQKVSTQYNCACTAGITESSATLGVATANARLVIAGTMFRAIQTQTRVVDVDRGCRDWSKSDVIHLANRIHRRKSFGFTPDKRMLVNTLVTLPSVSVLNIRRYTAQSPYSYSYRKQ